ncbi:MAG TPA: hypothetical protein VNF27_09085 [Candidatus Binataceae bacterium]|nr:hypothetical protein [Candidatus Binataceae bacterium]
MIHARIRRRPNIPLIVASSFVMLTFVQLSWPLGSITLKRHPAAATSHASCYRHTVEEVGNAGGPGATSSAMGFEKVGFNSTPLSRTPGVRRAGLVRSVWREQSRLFFRKLPPAASDPAH